MSGAETAAPIGRELRERRQALVERHAEAENRHDLDATMATFMRPRYEIVPTGDVYDGEEAVRKMHAHNWQAFPDFRSEGIALHHFEDGIVDESWMCGTHEGSFHGLPPTGRRIRFRVIALFFFEGDGLVCERVYYDTLEVMRGLGVARDPETLPGQLSVALSHPLVLGRAFARATLTTIRQASR